MARIMGDAARPCCNEGNSAGTGAGIGAVIRGDANRPEKAEDKVIDITRLDKTNKTPILVSY